MISYARGAGGIKNWIESLSTISVFRDKSLSSAHFIVADTVSAKSNVKRKFGPFTFVSILPLPPPNKAASLYVSSSSASRILPWKVTPFSTGYLILTIVDPSALLGVLSDWMVGMPRRSETALKSVTETERDEIAGPRLSNRLTVSV